MNEQKAGRNHFLGLRLTGDEYGVLEKGWKKSTLRKLSEYVRRLLFNKPVTVQTRNVSLDEFMMELILLKKELNAIGVNINQATHKLHTLDRIPQMQDWLAQWDRDKRRFFDQVGQIVSQLAKVEEQWLQ